MEGLFRGDAGCALGDRCRLLCSLLLLRLLLPDLLRLELCLWRLRSLQAGSAGEGDRCGHATGAGR